MSLDARYILCYEKLYDEDCHPRKKDIQYLSEKYGGYFEVCDFGSSVFWDKPKHLLPVEEIKSLLADMVLERRDCELWEIVK